MSADVGKIETPTAAADIVAGFQTFAASGGPTTVVTVPVNRTWVGTVTIQCASAEVAAGVTAAVATGTVTTAGASVTPAAGTYLRADSIAAANVAGGTAGTDSAAVASIPLTVSAGSGGAATIQATAAISGTLGQVSVSAAGVLQ